MNKIFTKIGVAFAGIAMAIGVGVAVGQSPRAVEKVDAADVEATFNSSLATNINAGDGNITENIDSLDSDIFTVVHYKNGASNGMYVKQNDFRMYHTKKTYAGNYFTVSVPSGYTIKTISLTTTSNGGDLDVFAGSVSVGADQETPNKVTGTTVTATNDVYTINSTEFTVWNNGYHNQTSNNRTAKFNPITIVYSAPANKLATPTNLTQSSGTLSWSAVSDVASYTITYDGVETTGIATNSYTVSNYAVGAHSFKVKAVAGSGYTDSDYSDLLEWDDRADAIVDITNVGPASIEKGETYQLNVETNPENLSVSFSTSSESIATVSASGLVTAVAAGSAIITASFAGNATYKPDSDTITINVTNSLPQNGTLIINSIDRTDTTGTSYANYDGSHATTIEGDSGAQVVWQSSNVMANNGLQFRSTPGYIYNTTPITDRNSQACILSITVTAHAQNTGQYKVFYGTTPNPTTSETLSSGDKYFRIQRSSGTFNASSITVTWGVPVSLNGITAVQSNESKAKTYYAGDKLTGADFAVTTSYTDSSLNSTITDGTGVYFNEACTETEFTLSQGNSNSVTVYYKDANNRKAGTAEPVAISNNVLAPRTDVTMEADDIYMYVGDSDITPAVRNASTSDAISGCAFVSGTTSAVTIVDGKVHAVAVGQSTITVTKESTTTHTYKTFTFKVTVLSTIESVVNDCLELASTASLSSSRTIKGTVTGLYGTNFMIQQGDYGMYVYSPYTDQGVAVGDVAVVSAVFGRYNKWVESRSNLSVTKLNEEPEQITPLAVSDPTELTNEHQNRLVSFTGLTYVSGSYTVGTGSNIEFKTTTDETVIYRTEAAVDDLIEAAIKTKIDAIKTDAGKNYVVDLIGVHYTFFNDGQDLQQFKVTSADCISYRAKTATDAEVVQQFVNEKLHWNDYYTDHDPINDVGDDACLGANGYYITAKNAFQLLTEAQQKLFRHIDQGENPDTYAEPRARYEAWATAYGDTTPYEANVTPRSSSIGLSIQDSNSAPAIIAVIAAVSTLAIGGFFFLRKRKIG